MQTMSKNPAQAQVSKKGDDAKTKTGKSTGKGTSIESNKKPLYSKDKSK